MSTYPDTLAISRKVLRVLIKLNILFGALIFALLFASVVAEGRVMAALGTVGSPNGSSVVFGMRLIMMIGIFAVPITHMILSGLLAMVETVRHGTPFVIENARRLRKMAWAMVGLELMNMVVAIIAANISTAAVPIDIKWSLSSRWLAVLLLFVLARVFEEGARMREELEGTV